MPFYKSLDGASPVDRRTIESILTLRRGLKEAIPDRSEETLLVASWNIRDLGKGKHGGRTTEALHYLAEIISRFDIVSIQEVGRNLAEFESLMSLLGPAWRYVLSDTTEGRRGNNERMAFVYDSGKVFFGGLAGELVLPPVRRSGEVIPANQVWRSPFITGFRAGWSKFMMTSVHIQWGASSADSPERIQEITDVARFLKKRTEDEDVWSRNLILLGDFNIFSIGDDTFRALTDADFTIPEEIQEITTNAGRNRHYDQIAFRVQPDRLDYLGRAGVFSMYDYVYREEALYGEEMAQASVSFNTWRTYMMSDHLPLWVELKIDYSDEYLTRKLRGE
jgi:hypothetical protein